MSREGKVEVYRDDAGEFRWRRKAGNGEQIGKSEEGYVNKAYALEVAAERNPGVLIIDLTLADAEDQ